MVNNNESATVISSNRTDGVAGDKATTLDEKSTSQLGLKQMLNYPRLGSCGGGSIEDYANYSDAASI